MPYPKDSFLALSHPRVEPEILRSKLDACGNCGGRIVIMEKRLNGANFTEVIHTDPIKPKQEACK